MTITPRVGVAGISFVHDVPGKEEKLVETVTAEVASYLMTLGSKSALKDGRAYDIAETITILRQEAGKNE